MPTNVTDAEMDTVFNILRHHIGKENAIFSQQINDQLGGIDRLDSTPRTREIIRGLRHQRNIPIGSSSNYGYWIIKDPSELHSTLAQLKEREEKIRATREALAEGVTKHGYALQKMETTHL